MTVLAPPPAKGVAAGTATTKATPTATPTAATGVGIQKKLTSVILEKELIKAPEIITKHSTSDNIETNSKSNTIASMNTPRNVHNSPDEIMFLDQIDVSEVDTAQVKAKAGSQNVVNGISVTGVNTPYLKTKTKYCHVPFNL